jgi:hypothetical protein
VEEGKRIAIGERREESEKGKLCKYCIGEKLLTTEGKASQEREDLSMESGKTKIKRVPSL